MNPWAIVAMVALPLFFLPTYRRSYTAGDIERGRVGDLAVTGSAPRPQHQHGPREGGEAINRPLPPPVRDPRS